MAEHAAFIEQPEKFGNAFRSIKKGRGIIQSSSACYKG